MQVTDRQLSLFLSCFITMSDTATLLMKNNCKTETFDDYDCLACCLIAENENPNPTTSTAELKDSSQVPIIFTINPINATELHTTRGTMQCLWINTMTNCH